MKGAHTAAPRDRAGSKPPSPQMPGCASYSPDGVDPIAHLEGFNAFRRQQEAEAMAQDYAQTDKAQTIPCDATRTITREQSERFARLRAEAEIDLTPPVRGVRERAEAALVWGILVLGALALCAWLVRAIW